MGFRNVYVLAIILAALSPRLNRVGGGAGDSWIEKRQQFASGHLGQVSLKNSRNLTGVWTFILEVEDLDRKATLKMCTIWCTLRGGVCSDALY